MRAYQIAFVIICAGLISIPASAESCENLTGLKLENATITAAETIKPGAFTLPAGSMPQQSGSVGVFNTLSAFCRVQGVIRPSADSHIEFEVWLPESGWNGKYLGVGNGGFAGYITFSELAEAVRNGYASSSTDTGHKAGPLSAEWGLGHPEKIVDYGHRAIHETAINAKAIIRAFYGSHPKHSYFSSCSNGGRQALMEAQRYPEDYDGIIAGAPASFWTSLGIAFTWNVQATEADPSSYIPAGKLRAIEEGALSACDALDGIGDRIISDPTKCRFDPETLLCSAAEDDHCLTRSQITALKKIYAGPRNSKGEQLYPGYLPGGETGPNGWGRYITGLSRTSSSQYAFGTQAYKYLVYQDPAWDYRTFDFDKSPKQDDGRMGYMNAVSPDLATFKKRGGKLIIYHGWSDAIVPPMSSVDYYGSVVSKMGERTGDFVRLYMVPGMQHCFGGAGPNSFGPQPSAQTDPQLSLFAAIERWVEKGIAPSSIVAAKYKVDQNPGSGIVRTRPLCPYPQIAKYKGTGSTDEAANFVCTQNR